MKICCFIGHRKIDGSQKWIAKIRSVIEKLIENGVAVFLFGSKSQFNDVCLQIVTGLKEKYPFIKRVYVRAEYEYISKEYEKYLLEGYEETYFAQTAHNAGKLVYIKRNQEMIERSDICVFYYDRANRKSGGTKIAFDYAAKRQKTIINVLDKE